MNTELISRISQIKQYISTLNESITVNDHSKALNMMSRFKKSVLKEDPHLHTSQFILDCLKAKNEKLKLELQQMQQNKKEIEKSLGQHKTKKKIIRQIMVEICITRLTLSLNDCKKVTYEEVKMNSDYSSIFVTSMVGKKYANYTIPIESIQNIQQKNMFLYFCSARDQNYHIIIKFSNQKDAQKWMACIKLGLMIIINNKEQKLFQQKSIINKNVSAPTLVAPIPLLFLNLNNKPISPTQSVISEKRSLQKSQDRSGDKSMQKNTERSLVNAMSNQGLQQSTYNFKQSLHPTKFNSNNRIEVNRPPNVRIRGRSDNLDSSLQISKLYKITNPRKQSEDIFKPHINQTYHQKMLEKLKSQDERSDQIRSQSNLPQKSHKSIESKAELEKSAKIKSLEDKKKQILKQINHMKVEKPTFAFDSKVSWAGIEEMEDENKSKSSIRVSNKSKRGSQFSESGIMASSDHVKKQPLQQQKSEHISEKSLEQSPRLPKKSIQAPQKSSYKNGYVILLNQVDKGVSSPNLPAKQLVQQKNLDLSISKMSMSKQSSSSSDEEQHSDPSSHQNHTQSQDNNARAEELKKGIILTKCSENGFWPHEKIVYLSENQNEIYSRDVKDKKIKKIKLSNVQSVEYKKFDKGIIRHISKIQEDKCLVIRALAEDNKIKNYEFVGNLAEPLERFASNLKLFVEYFKKQ